MIRRLNSRHNVDTTMIFWKAKARHMCGLWFHHKQSSSIIDLFSSSFQSFSWSVYKQNISCNGWTSLQLHQDILFTGEYLSATTSCCIVHRNSRNVINCQQERKKCLNFEPIPSLFQVYRKKGFSSGHIERYLIATMWSHNMRSNSSQWDTLESFKEE